MKKAEEIELLDEFWHKCMKRGLPMNVRQGATIDFADYALEILQDCVKIDEPLGTISHSDYEACPKCGAALGVTAFYCKKCGAYCRLSKDWG